MALTKEAEALEAWSSEPGHPGQQLGAQDFRVQTASVSDKGGDVAEGVSIFLSKLDQLQVSAGPVCCELALEHSPEMLAQRMQGRQEAPGYWLLLFLVTSAHLHGLNN